MGYDPSIYPKWSEDMKTGSEIIDAEHRRLIETLTRLIETPNPTPGELVELLTFFVEHSTEHFSTEEGLMNFYHYPHIEEHKSAHRLIQATLQAKIRPFIQGELTHAEAVRVYLWLFYDHLRLHDVQFVTYMKSKGGTA